jgi:uncharacterized protein (DUF2236 family)
MPLNRFRDFDHVDVDTETLPADLEELADEVDDPEEGFFGPESMVWRVNRENVAALTGQTAIFMQMSHPKIAAAGVTNSNYEEDPIGRARGTAEIVEAVRFADVETALEAAMIIRTMHTWVNGTIGEDVGEFEADAHYSANDPDLLLWVHATLIDQTLLAYEKFVEELTDAEKEQYYQEAKTFGRLFGIPLEKYPETLEEFWEYYETELEETIVVSDQALELQEMFLGGNTVMADVLTGYPERVYEFIVPATLPESLREQYGFEWTPEDQRRYDRFVSRVRRTLPLLPDGLRYNGEYLRNRRRLRRERITGPLPVRTPREVLPTPPELLRGSI